MSGAGSTTRPWLWLLTIFAFCICGAHGKTLKIYMHDMSVHNDEVNINSSLKLMCKANTRTRPCDYMPGISILVLRPISRVYVHFKIQDIDEGKLIVDQVVSLCNLRGVNGLNAIMKILFEEMVKHMNFLIACPFKPNEYTVQPFRTDNMGLLLSVVPRNRPYQETTVLKMRVGKKIEDIFRYEGKLEVVEVD